MTAEEQFVAVDFSIVNAGTSTGSITGSAAYIGAFSSDEWLNPNDYERNQVIPNQRFLTGATNRYKVISNTVDLATAYANGDSQVRLFGYVVYEDDVGNPRTTYFCRLHDRDSDRFLRPENSDYDSTD